MEVCERAREIIRVTHEDYKKKLEDLKKLIEQCESPVEQILLAALYDCWGTGVYVDLKSKKISFQLSADFPAFDGIFRVCCELQKTIVTWDVNIQNNYRVDFYIYITRFRLDPEHRGYKSESWPEMARLVVEVDGHEFHDRTKQQASYDRKRDRELTREGYRIVRFTGSDVYNEPGLCAEDIDYHINDLAAMVLNDYIERGKLKELIIG